MPSSLKSPNFQFLAKRSPHVHRLAAQAERYCFTEPDLCLTRLRQVIECLASQAVGLSGRFEDGERPDLHGMIREMESRGMIRRELADAFHRVRRFGNDAVHSAEAQQSTALHAIKLTRSIAIWYHRLTHENFKAGAFVPPPQPVDATDELRDELTELREKYAAQQQALSSAQDQSATLEQARAEAEAEAARYYTDLEAAMELAQESEERLAAVQEEFLAAQASTPKPSKEAAEAVVAAGAEASEQFLSELDEAETREIIDEQLRQAGWQADTNAIRHSKGTRPEKGKSKAIAEWPTSSGPVDYALFIGLELVAVAEAKKFDVDLPPVLGQARRYAEDIDPRGNPFIEGGPWGKYKVPFAFAGNGRPYLRQLPEKCGIHSHDLRKDTNHGIPLDGWMSPQGILEAMEADIDAANEELATTPIDLPGLRPFQKNAIAAVEQAIADDQREILLAMATGTGKTRTALSLIYRLVKAKRFRHILFLVDRTSLGDQAYDDSFSKIQLENLQTFTQIYDVKKLGEITPDPETRVHLATIQSMVHRILLGDDDPPPPVDQYDCVIIDECHRGYNLDKDMDTHEQVFRSEADFISKYRRVLDHFHAVKIGLTATPALHTTQIFGRAVFTYSYREAVTDGFLCDHGPPIRITTALSKHGIKWKKGDQVKFYDPKDGTLDLETAPDEVLKDVDTFNKDVITRPFNQTVCSELVSHLDPADPGKTLVFCVNDAHADLFVSVLLEEMEKAYGPQQDNLIKKITGKAVQGDKDLIQHFKNEKHPKIVVTVDLLTTGIDVEEITRLVFMRRVKSRILYEQMVGRATRLCRDLYGEGEDKTNFEIFDAVDLYSALLGFSNMKPVVQNPNASISETVGFLQQAADAGNTEAAEAFHRELMVKVRRRRALIEKAQEALALKFEGLTPATLLSNLGQSPTEALTLLSVHPELADWITSLRQGDGRRRQLISDHEDSIQEPTHRGYGKGNEKPTDYLKSFGAWIDDNKSKIEALSLVLTSPSSLTRVELKKLILAMDQDGFVESHLREAWREAKSENCAARLIGYIRTQSLGSPLIPFDDRVDQAVDRIMATTNFMWTQNQRRWLERIAKQVKKEILVDKDAFKAGAFSSMGGFSTVNKSFSGRLEELLTTFHEQIWEDSA